MGGTFSRDGLARFCSDIFPVGGAHELFVAEAQFGLSRLLPVLSAFDNPEIVEVGAGSCILSGYLASKGLRVTAVEPLGPEFDYFSNLQATVLEFCRQRGAPVRVVRATGEEFRAPGQFDVAFTINALEHMPDPLAALDNMYDSLKPGGVLLAHAPNYTVPFEPHFNIVLITRSKRVNERLYRSIVARRPAIWNSLTFIRYVDLRRHFRTRGLAFEFSKSMVADSVGRLTGDDLFAKRMPLWMRAAGAVARHLRLASALRRIPERLQSPMEVLVRKPGQPFRQSGQQAFSSSIVCDASMAGPM